MQDKQDFRSQGRAPRPVFFPDEPAADKLFAVVTALVTELAVLRERQDTLERLVDQNKLVATEDIDSYRADDDVEQARRAWRDAYIRRVFAVLSEDGDPVSGDTPMTPISKAG